MRAIKNITGRFILIDVPKNTCHGSWFIFSLIGFVMALLCEASSLFWTTISRRRGILTQRPMCEFLMYVQIIILQGNCLFLISLLPYRPRGYTHITFCLNLNYIRKTTRISWKILSTTAKVWGSVCENQKPFL